VAGALGISSKIILEEEGVSIAAIVIGILMILCAVVGLLAALFHNLLLFLYYLVSCILFCAFNIVGIILIAVNSGSIFPIILLSLFTGILVICFIFGVFILLKPNKRPKVKPSV